MTSKVLDPYAIGVLDDSVGWILIGDKVSHRITHLEDSLLDCTVHILEQFACGAVYDAGLDLTKGLVAVGQVV